MRKLLTLAIAIALFVCGVGAAGTLRRPPQYFGVPQVYDNHGRRVGPMVSPNVVLMQIKDRWFALPIGPSGFYKTGSVEMLFESSDCTGTPYMHPQSESFVEENDVVTPESYLVFPSKQVVDRYVKSTMPCTDPYSYLKSPTPPPAQCSQTTPTMMAAAPMEVFDLSQISMQAPFSFR